MKTVNLNWALPTTRVDGTPLAADAISHSIVLISADSGASYTQLARVEAPDTALVVPDLVAGRYDFRVIAVDRQTPSKSSAPTEVIVEFTDELAAPGAVTSLTATLV